MKNFLTAIALIASASAASAGSLSDPVIEAPVIVEEATSSSSGTGLVALLAVVLFLPVLTD